MEDTLATFAVRCSWCGLRFVPERWKAGHSFCKPAHRKAANRAGGDDAVLLVRPRSLRVAHLALDAGVPLDQLVLSQLERDVVIASRRRFGELQLEAAGRLMHGPFAKIGSDLGPKAPNVPTLQLDAVRRQLLLVDAVETLWEETDVVGNYRRNEFGVAERRSGRPRRVAPYVPAEMPWVLLFRDTIPRELERRIHERREQERAFANPRPNLGQEIVEPVISGGVYSEDGDQPSSKTVFRQPEVEQRRTRHELARDLREIKDELLGFQWRHGDPLQYVPPQRPAHPEPFYGDEGELDPRTKEYRKARAAHYAATPRSGALWSRSGSPPNPDKMAGPQHEVRFDKLGEEKVEMGTITMDIQERLGGIGQQLDRIEAEVREMKRAQSDQIQEQLGREAEDYLEEVD